MFWLQKYWADCHMVHKGAVKCLDYQNFKLEDGSLDILLQRQMKILQINNIRWLKCNFNNQKHSCHRKQ